jgi:hypothetical protein
MRIVIGALLSVTAATACSSSSTHTLKADVAGIPSGEGRLAGHLRPGAPPSKGTVPSAVTLTFSQGATAVSVVATGGRYEVDLAPGVWNVRSTDGNVCATGLTVAAGGWQEDDLVYPLGGCQDHAPPPPPHNPGPGRHALGR